MTASRIDVFKQMLAGDPANNMVRFGLANEYLKAGRYEEAIKELEDYLQRADDEGAAYGMLARAYEETGQTDRARAAYERGIEVAMAHGHPSMAEDYRMVSEAEFED